MSYGPHAVYSKTMASAGTLTGAFDLGRSFQNTYLVIPTISTGTELYIQGSGELTGTYRRIRHPSINSSTVTTNPYVIATNATSCIVPIPASGFRYLKVEASAAVNDGALFQIICGD